jgi:hypothetical protein
VVILVVLHHKNLAGAFLIRTTRNSCGYSCGCEKAFIYKGFPQHPQKPQDHYEHLLNKGKYTRKTRVHTHIRVYSSFLGLFLWMLW